MQVSITEAKADFSRLVRRAVAGEEIVITKAGRSKVVLRPLVPAGRRIGKRRAGNAESSANTERGG
jgi:prevent-host-death family protein